MITKVRAIPAIALRTAVGVQPDIRSKAAAPTSRRAFTLAECLIASTVLAVCVVGIVGPLSATYQQAAAVEEVNIAASLTQQLMDEIIARPYSDPTDGTRTLGPEVNESTRAAFDNVDDYHGYTDVTTSLKDSTGATINWRRGDVFTRSVAVEYRLTPSGPAAAAGDFALVTVKTASPSGVVTYTQRLVASYPRGN